MKELWLKKTKDGKGYILEIHEKFYFSAEQAKKLAKGEIKGMKLLELVERNENKDVKKPEVYIPKKIETLKVPANEEEF